MSKTLYISIHDPMGNGLTVLSILWLMCVMCLPVLCAVYLIRSIYLARKMQHPVLPPSFILLAALATLTLTLMRMATFAENGYYNAMNASSALTAEAHKSASAMHAAVVFKDGIASAAICIGLWVLLPHRTWGREQRGPG